MAARKAFALLATGSAIASAEEFPSHCPLETDTTVAYSLATGVGEASQIWIEDLLWWWQQNDASVKYQGLTEKDIQNCDLASYTNLRVYLNPGGNTYDQLVALTNKGRNNIKSFIERQEPSAYVGFCAGGYLASKGYYWETASEDQAYFEKLGVAPPLGTFPYNVEGSIADINDDQYGDADGLKYRVVNVSNGHKMLYYGGSTFGWNQVPAVTEDPDLEIVAYYTDFYGYQSYNLPAAWKYKNMFLTSIHPEADNCTVADCPAAGSVPEENILQNRAWLVTYINEVAGTDFVVPDVPVAPVFDTTPPHTNYPVKTCYQGGTARTPPTLFCDDFEELDGAVKSGLWNWQRTQTQFDKPGVWNTTYDSRFGSPAEGDGYAVASVSGTQSQWASLSTFPVNTKQGSAVSFQRKGTAQQWTVQYTVNAGRTWQSLPVTRVSQNSWSHESYPLPEAESLQVRFNCAGRGFCGLDSVYISAPTTEDVAV